MKRSIPNPSIIGLFILSLTISTGQKLPNILLHKDRGTSLSQLFTEARWKLDSQQKYRQVRVPFTQERGLIYVQALWAGKPVECVLDTGATYISWPQTLDLAATPTEISVHILGIGENRAYDGKWFLVPSLELGDLKLKNVPAISEIGVKKANGQKISLAPAEGIQKIILGNYVFENVVLTIDYQKQEVILRETDYDITRLPRLHSYLLDLFWDNDGSLVLLGQLAGHPARFQIDTGNTVGIVSNSAFAQKYLSAYRTKSTVKTAFEVISSEKIRGVNGNIGGIEFNTGTVTIVPLNSNVDVLVGESFLKNFRVTIDYSRRKVLLEPYSQSFRRLQVGSSS